ncbi:MAG TPA: flagellar biosynthesis protein FliQ [Bacillota bacterium]|nr:flagellar biosynthesis protein FliQ [Clostridiales bacterium]HPU18340.1 flagellar biosynthesis protein FliQ [Bacillota bacterium]
MLSQTEILTIIRNAVYVVLMSSLPMLGVALVIGVLISIFQATTQINEQTLAFAPKIIGILLSLLIFGGWIISNLTDFTTDLYSSINAMLR